MSRDLEGHRHSGIRSLLPGMDPYPGDATVLVPPPLLAGEGWGGVAPGGK